VGLKCHFKKMVLSTDEVRRIAALARLRVEPDEAERSAVQLSRIVGYIDQLRDVPASTEPTASGPPPNEREDQPGPCLERSLFLANAPQALDGFLVVPKVRADGD
jgi:aspartyl-tRNA(Asn)/glutamyl-tRNA(Gln) amidotransferase subunit C